jgi:MFS family permease
VPLYAAYALLFTHAGLSGARISALFAIWSAVGIVANVPAGALADRFSRRTALACGALCQAAGYALWLTVPVFAGFAAGFVLWGLGGALTSGALEALLYDGLAATGGTAHYARAYGRLTAATLVAQFPAALAATALYAAGGFPLVGWASVAWCTLTATLALRLPEIPRHEKVEGEQGNQEGGEGEVELGYLATLRVGIATAARPGVWGVLLAVAALTATDGVEEYFPLLAKGWGVPTGLVPLAVLGIPLAGAAGAALGGGHGEGRGRWRLAGLLAVGAGALALAGLWRRPAGLVAVAVFYGLYHLVLVRTQARLQDRVTGAARATVTSVGDLGTDVLGLALYGTWAAGGLAPFAVVLAVLAAALPRLLRPARRPGERG